MNWRLVGLLFVGLLLFTITGCGPQKQEETSSPKELPKWDDYKDKVQQAVFELVTAKEPVKQAQQRELDYVPMVRVILVLAPSVTLPEGFLILEESRYENEVQAFVPLNQLLELSQRPEIQYIRAPVKPKTR